VKVDISHKIYHFIIHHIENIPHCNFQLFRHGDRTIEKKIEGYLNDPYRSYDFYPVGNGQLTNVRCNY
jgi:hypothetical protein